RAAARAPAIGRRISSSDSTSTARREIGLPRPRSRPSPAPRFPSMKEGGPMKLRLPTRLVGSAPMRSHSRRVLVPVLLSACAALLALGGPAYAGDGTPFLMKVGTGGDLTLLFPAGALDPYTNMMSVSITPKRSGLCAVTGAFRTIQSDGPLQ